MNVHDYPIRVVETPVPDIDPEVLAHLDPNLHPPGLNIVQVTKPSSSSLCWNNAGNTKVTTTIKTYTYEIPGSGNYPTKVREDTTINEQYLDKLEKYAYSPNDTITTPSKSFVYNKVDKTNRPLYRFNLNDNFIDGKQRKLLQTTGTRLEGFHTKKVLPRNCQGRSALPAL